MPLYFANENCRICVEFSLSFEQIMSLVCSKPAQPDLTFETDQPGASFKPNVQACDQLDPDLIDKIKLAIAKLKTKTKEHYPHKNRY